MYLNIPDLLESFLGEHKKHSEDSGQITFDCPACSEDKGIKFDGKGNLEINYKKDVFKCWACHDINDMHGNISKLIYKYGNKTLAKEYLTLRPTTEYNRVETKKIESVVKLKLPSGYKRLSDSNHKDYLYDEAITYLKDRGITDFMIDYYDIGYVSSGEFKNRIVIPSYDKNGELNYYIARTFNKYTKPKYKNPDCKKELIIFNEGKINIDSTIYLVEGGFDHIVIPNSIPLLGKKVYDLLFYFLQDVNADIVIILDPDAVKDAIFNYKKLNTGKLHGRIKIAIPPHSYDPSKIFEVLGNKGITKLLRSSVVISESRL